MPRQSADGPGNRTGSTRRLAIYLNDHLAGSIAGGELAKRAARSNRGTRYGDSLSELADQIQEDRNALTDLMRRLGIGADPLKRALAWWAEKLGRGKLNGSLISYSPLSRLEELEFLSLGVEGKLLMWLALRELADHDDRIAAVDLERLIRRARAQRRRLERHRLAAATEALME